MNPIYRILLSTLLLFCFVACDKGGTEAATSDEELEKLSEKDPDYDPDPVYHDSADLTRYMPRWADQVAFGDNLKQFYRSRNYRVAWFSNRKLRPHAAPLLARLRHVEYDGLDPEEYDLDKLNRLYGQIKPNKKVDDDEQIRDFDLMLTTLFFRYANQMANGVTTNRAQDFDWYIEKKEDELPIENMLQAILKDNAKGDPYDVLEPQHPQYDKLRQVLKRYIAYNKSGGWNKINVSKLKLGDTSEEVVKVRQQLIQTGDLTFSPENVYDPKIFDAALEQSVKLFQARHGLGADGVVGGNTLTALNTSVQERIRQIQVNLERWRLVPRDMGDTFILVNVPEFRLYVNENGKDVLTMRVVTGEEFNATPVFQDKLEYIVFRPYWNIPQSIMVEEILPAIYNDPSYLSRNNMEAVNGFGQDPPVVNFWSVDWSNAADEKFTYRIRQKPGPDNPLGLVKFIFPNQYNIYLHDTPFDHLFDKVRRDYSHGCIRVEKPVQLAKYLTGWSDDKVKEKMENSYEEYVNAPQVPVYILYFTAWVDDNGQANFRPDIYGYDQKIASQLY